MKEEYCQVSGAKLDMKNNRDSEDYKRGYKEGTLDGSKMAYTLFTQTADILHRTIENMDKIDVKAFL